MNNHSGVNNYKVLKFRRNHIEMSHCKVLKCRRATKKLESKDNRKYPMRLSSRERVNKKERYNYHTIDLKPTL